MAGHLLEQIKGIDEFKDLPPERLAAISEVAEKLAATDLFVSLGPIDVALIAAKGRLLHYESGDLIIRKGDTDKTFYVITRGQVRVWDTNGHGSPQLLNYHSTGDFFGELAPLNNEPRAANVDVVDDVDVMAFGADGFGQIVKHREIADYLRTWGRERIQKSNRDFEGKHWDEISIVLTHKSWFALLRVVLFPSIVILLTLTVFGLLLGFTDLSGDILLSLAIAITVGMGLWIFWMYEDWHNDDLIVTSKRIIHIERVLVPPFPIERHEAAIRLVQDITTRNHGLWTFLFNVHTLEVKTAGSGTIRFPYLDNASQIRNEIFRARDLASIRRLGEERSRIRQKLMNELERPAKQVTELFPSETPPKVPDRRGLVKLLDYFVPHTRIVQPHQIVWRKHWLILVRDAGPAFMMLILSLALLVVGLVRPGFLRNISMLLTALIPFGLLIFSLGWYLWNYDGWRNDVYIVTNERIIDIEGSPFHLQKESHTEGTFDVIQNSDYSSPNWFFRILRIGDVTIDTASKRNAFTFNSVARPEEVQQEIFKRLAAFREKRENEDAERQYAEMTKWFGTYHRSVMGEES